MDCDVISLLAVLGCWYSILLISPPARGSDVDEGETWQSGLDDDDGLQDGTSWTEDSELLCPKDHIFHVKKRTCQKLDYVEVTVVLPKGVLSDKCTRTVVLNRLFYFGMKEVSPSAPHVGLLSGLDRSVRMVLSWGKGWMQDPYLDTLVVRIREWIQHFKFSGSDSVFVVICPNLETPMCRRIPIRSYDQLDPWTRQPETTFGFSTMTSYRTPDFFRKSVTPPMLSDETKSPEPLPSTSGRTTRPLSTKHHTTHTTHTTTHHNTHTTKSGQLVTRANQNQTQTTNSSLDMKRSPNQGTITGGKKSDEGSVGNRSDISPRPDLTEDMGKDLEERRCCFCRDWLKRVRKEVGVCDETYVWVYDSFLGTSRQLWEIAHLANSAVDFVLQVSKEAWYETCMFHTAQVPRKYQFSATCSSLCKTEVGVFLETGTSMLPPGDWWSHLQNEVFQEGEFNKTEMTSTEFPDYLRLQNTTLTSGIPPHMACNPDIIIWFALLLTIKLRL